MLTKKTLTLYHGTCKKSAESILKYGFYEFSCLTDNLEVAEYYAECASEESGFESIVLKIDVSTDNLEVDYNAYDEPLTYYRNEYATSDSDWHDMIENDEIPYPTDQNDYQTALDVTWSVRNKRKISPKYIVVVTI